MIPGPLENWQDDSQVSEDGLIEVQDRIRLQEGSKETANFSNSGGSNIVFMSNNNLGHSNATSRKGNVSGGAKPVKVTSTGAS